MFFRYSTPIAFRTTVPRRSAFWVDPAWEWNMFDESFDRDFYGNRSGEDEVKEIVLNPFTIEQVEPFSVSRRQRKPAKKSPLSTVLATKDKTSSDPKSSDTVEASNSTNAASRSTVKEFRFTMDLPGVKADDIDVQIRDGYLNISATRKVPIFDDTTDIEDDGSSDDKRSDEASDRKRSVSADKPHTRQIGTKKYHVYRSISLGDRSVDVSQLKANLDSGVLMITAPFLPVKESVVKIKVSTEPHQLLDKEMSNKKTAEDASTDANTDSAFLNATKAQTKLKDVQKSPDNTETS